MLLHWDLFFLWLLLLVEILDDKSELVINLLVSIVKPVFKCPAEIQRVQDNADLFKVASMVFVCCNLIKGPVDNGNQNVHHHDSGEDLEDKEEDCRDVGLVHAQKVWEVETAHQLKELQDEGFYVA